MRFFVTCTLFIFGHEKVRIIFIVASLQYAAQLVDWDPLTVEIVRYLVSNFSWRSTCKAMGRGELFRSVSVSDFGLACRFSRKVVSGLNLMRTGFQPRFAIL